MKRALGVLSGSVLITALLVSCGNDDGEDTDSAGENGAAEETQTADDSNAGDVPKNEDDFEDQFGLALGEIGYISTTLGQHAFTVEDVEFHGFWEFVREHGYEPHSSFDPELVAVVDVTLENVGDTTFDADEGVGNLEFGDSERVEEEGSGRGTFIQFGDPDFDVEGLIEGDLLPGDSATGKLYFPVFDSEVDSWGVTMQAGIVACCATNDITWIFDADHEVDVAADEQQYR